MDHTHLPLIAVAVALGLSVVLRSIFTARRRPRGPSPRAPQAPRASADRAWDGAARRRRDLAA